MPQKRVLADFKIEGSPHILDDGDLRKVARIKNTDGDPGDTIFVGETEPSPDIVEGDVWIDGSGGGGGTNIPVQPEPPENPDINELWFDTDEEVEDLITPAAVATAGAVMSDGGDITKIRRMTQAEYDALVTRDSNTLYVIQG